MNISTILIILIIYGLIFLGIYKYNVLHFVQFQSRNEVLLIIFTTLILILKLLIDCTSSITVSFSTNEFQDLNNFFLSIFNKNNAVVSFFSLIVTFLPAVLFQMLYLDEIFRKKGIDRMALFLYIVCYLINPFVFKSINITISELLLYLLINTFILFLVLTLKDSLTLKTGLYLIALFACIIYLALIKSNISVNLYIASLATVIESLVLGIYRTKSIIFRSGLRYLGTFVILAILVLINISVL